MPELLVFPQEMVLQALDRPRRSSACATASSSTPAASGRCRRRSISTPRLTGTSARCRRREPGSRSSSGSRRFRATRGRAAGGDGRDLRVVGGGRRAAGPGGRALRDRAADRRRGGGRGTGAGARGRARASGIIGCGLHGTWAARCLAAAEYGPGICFDPDPEAAGRLAGELGWEVGTREDALGCDVVTCVTPGNEPVVRAGDLRPGLHLNMLGADGPGKAEAEPEAVAACRAVLRRVGAGQPRRRAHRRGGGGARDGAIR